MRKHLPKYLSELFGTAIVMMVGIGAIALMWGSGARSGWSELAMGLRRLLTGILFAGGGMFVAYPRSDSAVAVT